MVSTPGGWWVLGARRDPDPHCSLQAAVQSTSRSSW